MYLFYIDVLCKSLILMVEHNARKVGSNRSESGIKSLGVSHEKNTDTHNIWTDRDAECFVPAVAGLRLIAVSLGGNSERFVPVVAGLLYIPHPRCIALCKTGLCLNIRKKKRGSIYWLLREWVWGLGGICGGQPEGSVFLLSQVVHGIFPVLAYARNPHTWTTCACCKLSTYPPPTFYRSF